MFLRVFLSPLSLFVEGKKCQKGRRTQVNRIGRMGDVVGRSYGFIRHDLIWKEVLLVQHVYFQAEVLEIP